MASKNREVEVLRVDRSHALIVCDDDGLSREICDRWKQERNAPDFTVLGSVVASDVDHGAFDLNIVVGLRPETLLPVLHKLDSLGKPAILVCDPNTATGHDLQKFSRVLVLQRHEGCFDTLILLANEVLRRVEAVNRAQRLEQINALLRCHATLGQYMIDMRHTMNNALTSVLGNAELMLLEPGTFSAGVRSQIDTIRNMALRLHEILQRFSSLEKEMMFVEKQAAKEQADNTQAAAVGQ